MNPSAPPPYQPLVNEPARYNINQQPQININQNFVGYTPQVVQAQRPQYYSTPIQVQPPPPPPPRNGGRLGAISTLKFCPCCQEDVMTKTTQQPSVFACMVAIGFIIVGILLFPPLIFCFCLPFFVPEWQDVAHNCPHCDYSFGIFKR